MVGVEAGHQEGVTLVESLRAEAADLSKYLSPLILRNSSRVIINRLAFERPIRLLGRMTPSLGKELTILQQGLNQPEG